jgi:hypothetical protein
MTTAPKIPTPATLDEIVTRHRGVIQIGLATEAEIATLAGVVDAGPNQGKDMLSDWRLVSIRHIPTGDVVVRLLGDRVHTRGPVITSPVVGLDLERGRARTWNSIYGLADRGDGEPPPEQILGLCAWLHRRGFGKALGVIHIFL